MRGNLRSYWAAILAVVSARTSGEGSAIRRTTSCWERLPVISLSVRPQQTREFRRQQAHTAPQAADYRKPALRSEEHTSELQSLMRISYAVFCLKKKKKRHVHP